jgi:hypothetical protein
VLAARGHRVPTDRLADLLWGTTAAERCGLERSDQRRTNARSRSAAGRFAAESGLL